MLDQKWVWLDHAGPKRAIKRNLPDFTNPLDFCSTHILLLWTFAKSLRWTFARPKMLWWSVARPDLGSGFLLVQIFWGAKIAPTKRQIIKQEKAFPYVFLTRSYLLSNHGSSKRLFIRQNFCPKNFTCIFIAHYGLKCSQQVRSLSRRTFNLSKRCIICKKNVIHNFAREHNWITPHFHHGKREESHYNYVTWYHSIK